MFAFFGKKRPAGPNHETEVIYDDEVSALLSSTREITVFRASWVETPLNLPKETVKQLKKQGRTLDPSLWYVDFSPIRRRVILGPYKSRDEALRDEREWLCRNHLNSTHQES